MVNNISLKAVLVAGSVLASSQALAFQPAHPPGGVEFSSVTPNGSGCPHGTVDTTISPDQKAFTVSFSQYEAEAGFDVHRKENRKNCNLTILLNYPSGWQYSITKFDYRGFVSLDRGVTGTQQVQYWFQGMGHGKANTTFRGPIDQDYHETDFVKKKTWSPCGAQRALNVNSSIYINNRRNRSGGGYMSLDSVDGSVVWEFGMEWRPCRR